ncbi:MAG: radical SAM protein [bacterium]
MLNKYLPLNRLEFAVTYQCNGKCIHCYTVQGKHKYPLSIDGMLGEEIVESLTGYFNIESVMTFGGEPLLFPQITAKIHRKAKDKGIPSREVITNGYWSNHFADIVEIANLLCESGVNELIFSVDSFHQQFIPVDIVRKSIIASVEAKIDKVILNPCWINGNTNENEYNNKTKSILASLSDLPVIVSEGNIVEPVGLARNNLTEFFPPKKPIPGGRCEEVPYSDRLDSISSICIEPDGKVAVCNDLHIGNAGEDNIIEILKSYDPYKNPVTNAILSGGLKELVNYARTYDIEPDIGGYYSICDLCTDIRHKIAELLK